MRSPLRLLASWPFPGSLETSSESPHSNLGLGKVFVCLLLFLFVSLSFFYSNSFRVLCLQFMDFDSLLLYFVCQVRDKDLISFSYVRYPVLPALLVKVDAFFFVNVVLTSLSNIRPYGYLNLCICPFFYSIGLNHHAFSVTTALW